MKKQKNNGGSTRSAQLIAQLDQLATKHGEVALVTEHGSIYSWQTHKLSNLTKSMKKSGTPFGFVMFDYRKDGTAVVTLRNFYEGHNGRTEALIELIEAIDELNEVYDCQYQGDYDDMQFPDMSISRANEKLDKDCWKQVLLEQTRSGGTKCLKQER